MLVEWADDDPVSPWESERDKRIADPDVQGNHNPYVEGWEPDAVDGREKGRP